MTQQTLPETLYAVQLFDKSGWFEQYIAICPSELLAEQTAKSYLGKQVYSPDDAGPIDHYEIYSHHRNESGVYLLVSQTPPGPPEPMPDTLFAVQVFSASGSTDTYCAICTSDSAARKEGESYLGELFEWGHVISRYEIISLKLNDQGCYVA